MREPACCRGQAVPYPPAWQGRGMTPSPGYGWRSRRGWAPAVRPGLKPRAESPSPLKGAVRRSGARVVSWVQAPCGSADLGTEPGRERPGDRGEGRSADPRCVSCETCRPRGIAAPPARRARQRLAPTRVGQHAGGGIGRRGVGAGLCVGGQLAAPHALTGPNTSG